MLQRIDACLLQIFQACAHWIERHTGITNFTLARFLAVCWGASVVAEAFRDHSVLGLKIAWIALAMTLPVVMFSWFWLIANLERQAGRSTFSNQDKIISYGARQLQLSLTVCLSSLALLAFKVTPIDVGTVAICAHYYFRAADRMPPQRESEPLFVKTLGAQS